MSNIIKVNDVFETIECKGTVRMVTRDANHNIVDERTEHNNILLTIRKPIVKLLGGAMTPNSELPFINSIGFGTDDTPPAITQTGLGAEVNNSRRLIAMAPTFSNDGLRVTFAVLYDLVEPDVDNIDLKEACLYTADGTAVARTVIGSYKKIEGMYFEFYWEVGYAA